MGVTKVRAQEEKEEKPKEKKVARTARIEKPEEKELRAIVRVAGSDLDGERPLRNALMGIKGIGYVMSKAICEVGNFDPNVKLGSLTTEEMIRLEAVIKEPMKFGVPVWALNRRNEPETGVSKHLTGDDLEVAKKFDVQKMIDLKTYRGMRHMLGQPVRGQRTRSSFREGKVVGVVKKTIKFAMEKKEEEKKKK